ncbi:MAG: hypothetical protein JSW73_01005 [Candidatus Woesearchaeota archaeon]|nr:MAG: hypothetical protein JSW73_01005 [Candidatus Woesearchaeota archaeon]
MKRIKLPKEIQKSLIEHYKNKKSLSWKELSRELNIGESTLRSSYRNGRLSLKMYIFDKLTAELSKDKKQELLRQGRIIKDRRYSKSNFKNSNRNKAVDTLYKKYGNNFFSKIGLKGAKITNKMWTLERRIKQSSNGKKGGNKKVKNIEYFTEQEREVANQNTELELNFKTNYFLSKDYNFDFVYFYKNKPIAVEETTINAFRGFTDFLEKRNFLDKKYGKDFPFIVTVRSKKRLKDLAAFLLENNIFILTNLQQRRKYFLDILNKNTVKKLKEKLFSDVRKELKIKSEISKTQAYKEKGLINDYEQFVNSILFKLGLSPLGKEVFKSPFGFYYVSDNLFRINNTDIAVLVSYCNSRGSLLYQLYKHATYAYILKRSSNVKIMSIIFDYSSTATAFSNNKPKNLCFKYSDYYVVTFKKDNLADEINKAIYGRVA